MTEDLHMSNIAKRVPRLISDGQNAEFRIGFETTSSDVKINNVMQRAGDVYVI